VDLLIIKKEAGFTINNKIADIFKTHNIIEYKSPSDYISIHDFNKVLGYAYFYSALHKVDVRDITITFAGNHYPSKLFEHIVGELGYSVKEAWSGIYHISGGTMAMQLINRKRLSGESLWVKGLGDDLSFEELNRLIAGSVEEKSAVQGAYMDLVLNANKKSLEEKMKLDRKNWIKFEDVVKRIKEDSVLWAIVEENKRLRRENEQERERFRQDAEQERERFEQERERFRQETERLRREIEQLRGNV
jgi:hypothetical protein